MTCFTSKVRQAGFTLIELMVAMLISLTLVFACTALYSSLKESIQLAQGLATAQDSLRSSYFLMSRSVRQAVDLDISGAQFTTTYGAPPTDGSPVYNCLGRDAASAATDTFYAAGGYLYCDDGSGAEKIALAVTKMTLLANTGTNYDGLIVQLEIAGMPATYASGATFTLALRQKILSGL